MIGTCYTYPSEFDQISGFLITLGKVGFTYPEPGTRAVAKALKAGGEWGPTV